MGSSFDRVGHSRPADHAVRRPGTQENRFPHEGRTKNDASNRTGTPRAITHGTARAAKAHPSGRGSATQKNKDNPAAAGASGLTVPAHAALAPTTSPDTAANLQQGLAAAWAKAGVAPAKPSETPHANYEDAKKPLRDGIEALEKIMNRPPPVFEARTQHMGSQQRVTLGHMLGSTASVASFLARHNSTLQPDGSTAILLKDNNTNLDARLGDRFAQEMVGSRRLQRALEQKRFGDLDRELIRQLETQARREQAHGQSDTPLQTLLDSPAYQQARALSRERNALKESDPRGWRVNGKPMGYRRPEEGNVILGFAKGVGSTLWDVAKSLAGAGWWLIKQAGARSGGLGVDYGAAVQANIEAAQTMVDAPQAAVHLVNAGTQRGGAGQVAGEQAALFNDAPGAYTGAVITHAALLYGGAGLGTKPVTLFAETAPKISWAQRLAAFRSAHGVEAKFTGAKNVTPFGGRAATAPRGPVITITSGGNAVFGWRQRVRGFAARFDHILRPGVTITEPVQTPLSRWIDPVTGMARPGAANAATFVQAENAGIFASHAGNAARRAETFGGRVADHWAGWKAGASTQWGNFNQALDARVQGVQRRASAFVNPTDVSRWENRLMQRIEGNPTTTNLYDATQGLLFGRTPPPASGLAFATNGQAGLMPLTGPQGGLDSSAPMMMAGKIEQPIRMAGEGEVSLDHAGVAAEAGTASQRTLMNGLAQNVRNQKSGIKRKNYFLPASFSNASEIWDSISAVDSSGGKLSHALFCVRQNLNYIAEKWTAYFRNQLAALQPPLSPNSQPAKPPETLYAFIGSKRFYAKKEELGLEGAEIGIQAIDNFLAGVNPTELSSRNLESLLASRKELIAYATELRKTQLPQVPRKERIKKYMTRYQRTRSVISVLESSQEQTDYVLRKASETALNYERDKTLSQTQRSEYRSLRVRLQTALRKNLEKRRAKIEALDIQPPPIPVNNVQTYGAIRAKLAQALNLSLPLSEVEVRRLLRLKYQCDNFLRVDRTAETLTNKKLSTLIKRREELINLLSEHGVIFTPPIPYTDISRHISDVLFAITARRWLEPAQIEKAIESLKAYLANPHDPFDSTIYLKAKKHLDIITAWQKNPTVAPPQNTLEGVQPASQLPVAATQKIPVVDRVQAFAEAREGFRILRDLQEKRYFGPTQIEQLRGIKTSCLIALKSMSKADSYYTSRLRDILRGLDQIEMRLSAAHVSTSEHLSTRRDIAYLVSRMW